MHVLRDGKLWKAVGLAIAIFAPLVLHVDDLRLMTAGPLWSRFWPAIAGAAACAVAVVSGCVLRPGRPQRFAALTGFIGAMLLQVIPRMVLVFPLLPEFDRQPLSATSCQLVFGWLATYPPSLALAAWIGADYWRARSLAEFWRGPTSAIARGGVIAGTMTALLWPTLFWWALPYMAAKITGQPTITQWEGVALSFPSVLLEAIVGRALFTAALARWRPSPLLGAFAGSGIAAGFLGLSMLMWGGMNWAPTTPHLGLKLMYVAAHLLDSVATAAIAGSFAGRWEPEPLPDEPSG